MYRSHILNFGKELGLIILKIFKNPQYLVSALPIRPLLNFIICYIPELKSLKLNILPCNKQAEQASKQK